MLSTYSTVVNTVYIAAKDGGIHVPEGFKLPTLGSPQPQATDPPAVPPADTGVKAADPPEAPKAPLAQAPTPEAPKPQGKPKRDDPEVLQQTVIGAIKEKLLMFDGASTPHWRSPAAKDIYHQVFGNRRFPDLDNMPLDKLQQAIVLIEAQLLKASTEKLPQAASAPSTPALGTQVGEKIPPGPNPEGKGEHSHPSLPSPAPEGKGVGGSSLSPEQKELKDLAISYGIREGEAEKIIRSYSLDQAKQIINRSIEMRRKVAQKGPLLATA